MARGAEARQAGGQRRRGQAGQKEGPRSRATAREQEARPHEAPRHAHKVWGEAPGGTWRGAARLQEAR